MPNPLAHIKILNTTLTWSTSSLARVCHDDNSVLKNVLLHHSHVSKSFILIQNVTVGKTFKTVYMNISEQNTAWLYPSCVASTFSDISLTYTNLFCINCAYGNTTPIMS